MRKANKKLASAIVLGLMLAVPVGASAETITVDKDTVYTGPVAANSTISGTAGTENITFVGDPNKQFSMSANSGGTAEITKVNNITIKETWKSDGSVFYTNGANSNLNITASGTIASEGSVPGSKPFHAMGGQITVNAGAMNIVGAGNAVFAQTNGGGVEGHIDITATTGDIYLSTNTGVAVGAASLNSGESNKKSTVSLTSTAGNITISSNGTAVSAYGSDWKTGEAIANSNEVKITADAGKVTINGGKNAILAKNGQDAGNQAKVEVTGNNIEINGNIVADKNAAITIGGPAAVETEAETSAYTANIKGDIKATDSVINLDLGTNGSLTGSVVYNSSTAGVATLNNTTVSNGININMGSGSVWNVTGDSTVTELEGEGVVKIADAGVKEVKIGEVAEGSNITYGNTAAVTDTFKTAEDAKKYFDMITVNGKEISTYTADAGAVFGEIEVSSDGTVKEGVNANNQGISEMASIGLMAWRAENNDMNKRLGELRNSNGEHGVWARMVRGESEYGAQNVKNVYNTYQLGYDEKLSTNDHWTVGAAISYTDGQSSFATGSGENTSKGLSFYGSYLGDNGEFVDLIAKYARLDNEFDVVGSGAGSCDYSTNGYSFSAEFGKRNELANDFYFEPQVELTYGRVADVDYVTSKEVKVSQDSMESLVGRVGFAAGKNIKNGNVYVRASYLYDFDGETSVTFAKDGATPRTFEEDLGGGWFEFGIGTNINLSDATYLYLDVEKTTGGEVDTNWQWNAGVRYSF